MVVKGRTNLGHRELISHLLRRAGAGATPQEVDYWSQKSYQEVVEDVLNPEEFPEIEGDMFSRYYLDSFLEQNHFTEAVRWMYCMVNSKRPLQEKMTLFWHHVLATAWYKSESPPDLVQYIVGLREIGLSNLKKILVYISKDAAMIDWLDNNQNHSGEPNENYGRELLELFSMGAGNYTEKDVKECSRAFTGWTHDWIVPGYPHGRALGRTKFVFLPEDHDNGIKEFLGESGNFDGEEIIDIIIKQMATAGFICRHLYNFFVADEPQVPSWGKTIPLDPETIDLMVEAYIESNADMKSILRALFHSEGFKQARYKHVKSPVEFVVSTVKLAGTHQLPMPDLFDLGHTTTAMGQQLLNPPTVEGWHTGHEWIDGGTLNERVNFAVNHLNSENTPGVDNVIRSLESKSESNISKPQDFVDACLEQAGSMTVGETTLKSLIDFAESDDGVLILDGDEQENAFRVTKMLQLIVSAPEFQFA